MRQSEVGILACPVKPGDTLTPSAVVKGSKDTDGGRWIGLDVQVLNQPGELVAAGGAGEAMVEIPLAS